MESSTKEVNRIGAVVAVGTLSPAAIVKRLRSIIVETGVTALQLGIAPLVRLDEAQQQAAVEALLESGIHFTATYAVFPGEDYTSLETIADTGGFRPARLFQERLALIQQCAAISRRLGISLLSTHVGFIPQQSQGMDFSAMRDRLRSVSDALAAHEITLCFETGQETAQALAEFLAAVDRTNIAVNFDPGNMILYGNGPPAGAIDILHPFIQHVHAKDARQLNSPAPGQWAGEEVPLGNGDADWHAVLRQLARYGCRGAVAIEREGGNTWANDVRAGAAFLQRLLVEAR